MQKEKILAANMQEQAIISYYSVGHKLFHLK